MEVKNKHFYKIQQGDVYIGRPSIFGNPYSSQLNANLAKFKVKEGTAIEEFKRYFYKRIYEKDQEFLDALNKLTPTSNLVCWCNPRACHGDVIKEYLEAKWDKEAKLTPSAAIPVPLSNAPVNLV